MPSNNHLVNASKQMVDDRTSLLEKARAFLTSPDIRHENPASKRRFLQEKGLTDDEIDILMGELQRLPPPVPPRTYPPPPPSNLPFLLASIFRIATWTIGMSGVILLAYYKVLLPRISRNLDARHSLKLHQSTLLQRLHTRLGEVRKEQDKVAEALDKNGYFTGNINALADVPVDGDACPSCPLSLVIRCVLLEHPSSRYSIDDMYNLLTERYSGLLKRPHLEIKESISEELSHTAMYTKQQENGREVWSLTEKLTSVREETLVSRLQGLRTVLSQFCKESGVYGMYGHTFKALTDLTAYISRETFPIYGGGLNLRYGFSNSTQLTPAQEEVRREIRALKGLVLNRRSFTPNPSRQSPSPVNS